MARPDIFYVFEWRNEALDSHPHYAWLKVDGDDTPVRHLQYLLTHNENLKIDLKQKLVAYATQADAEKEAKRLGDVADAADPDRVGADRMFAPGEANRALSVGMQGPK